VRRRQWGSIAAACAIAVACLPAPVAAAAPDDDGRGSDPERACVVSVTPQSTLVPAAESQVVDFRCFDSLRAALSHVGASAPVGTRDASGATRGSVTALGPVLGVNYSQTDFSGEVLVLTAASGNGCLAGASYTFPDLSLYGFDNKISSAEMYSNCIARYHADKDLTGDSKYCDRQRCAALGGMNRRASSVKFF